MENTYKKRKNLFLQQSYRDSWEDYERSINKDNFITWDYLIITASNEEQAANFREQIAYRQERGLLPSRIHYAVLPDPEGKRVGSGGATLHVMKYIREQEPDCKNPFEGKRILVIHSGGDSKRVPQYSAMGKLFSPVPRELPNGRASTLFDEFIIGMSGVPSRFREGMLVLSGDVLLLFNPLQIDAQFHGAAAISIKEDVSIGKNHGVFLNDGKDCVKAFLHKQTEESLHKVGAVNERGKVDLDTGAVLFDAQILEALLGLISTDGKIDDEKYHAFVNEKARISFYGDFLYPLASDSTLEAYYKEQPEGSFTEELKECRTKIWDAIHDFSIKLLCLAPAEFIHFGTTGELLHLVTEEVEDYEFLDWKKHILSTAEEGTYATHGSYVGKHVCVGEKCYLENSFVLGTCKIGSGSILSNMYVRDTEIPENIVVHGLQLPENKYLVRVYGVKDNPKNLFQKGNSFLGEDMECLMPYMRKEDMGKTLWDLPLYTVCDSRYDALQDALLLYRMVRGQAEENEIERWKKKERLSLNESYNKADIHSMFKWYHELEDRILSSKFIWALEEGAYYKDALKIFGKVGITEKIFHNLLSDGETAENSLKIRIYYALSRYMKINKVKFEGKSYDTFETLCFQHIQNEVLKHSPVSEADYLARGIVEDEVKVELPVRVNWGGGWTDTPPYCVENGGIVLNAALRLNGKLPVQVCVRKLEQPVVEFASEDMEAFGVVTDIEEIRNCHNPYDLFALHKAALIACGIIPTEGDASLEEILTGFGGGIFLSTQVVGIPKGSGLGTSSILSGACVKALFQFFGIEKTQQEIFATVSCMEQIMSTGGGWQDQVGGLTTGVKLISTRPGGEQNIHLEPVIIEEKVKKELQERFALIYTGQRRLARNLLRDVVGGYIGSRPESVRALKEMQSLAVLMCFELERGNIDEFAKLMNQHWEMSKLLDSGCTNTCIDQIFLSCEDLIDGKFICGAGGGGFLQVILKKGVTKENLRVRLRGVFQDSGVDVWEGEFLW